jgi:hypothetical protein
MALYEKFGVKLYNLRINLMAKLKYGVVFSVLALSAIHFSSSAKASTEDEVMQLWGVIAARQATRGNRWTNAPVLMPRLLIL